MTQNREVYCMSNVYFYMRISTKESSDKQSFQRQDRGLRRYAEDHKLSYNNRTVYKDDVSGMTFDRDDWKALEKILKEGDTIVFKEISRFTRQALVGYDKYMELMNKGINLVFLDNPSISTDYIKQLINVANSQELVTKTVLENTVRLLLMVELDRVEKEREIFIQRIKDGIEASDKKSGRKVGQLDKLSEALEEDIKEFLNNRDIKQIELMRKYNISRNTLKKYIQVVKKTR